MIHDFCVIVNLTGKEKRNNRNGKRNATAKGAKLLLCKGFSQFNNPENGTPTGITGTRPRKALKPKLCRRFS